MLNLCEQRKIFLIIGVLPVVNTGSNKLHQLMLLEEFKSCCLPSEIKKHLDEQRAEYLHQAATYVSGQMIMHLPIRLHLKIYSHNRLRMLTKF